MTLSLPIESILGDARAALGRASCLVIEAPPGAGKTTRVPPALLDVVEGEILVLQPRRLAARLGARFVAEERGERVGETVGYQVRFEEAASARTRIRFVTEGVLTRRLLGDPALHGVGAVILDEFHERHLQGDLALALLRRLQRTSRPELRLVVMSATLDAEPIAAWLGGCARLRAEGRRFDVAIEYGDAPDDRPLEKRISAAVRRLAAEGLDGDVLVFLPGAAEIARAGQACAEVAARHGLAVLPLHGDLSPAEQDRAIRPSEQRRVILSTNVAETSVTLPSVTAVVDSGLARMAAHSPWSGLPQLKLAKISRASAAQRAGRAGRTRDGRCLRTYTRHDHDSRPAFEPPEIKRLDLADTFLALHATGVRDARGFEWLEPPTEAAARAAAALLARLDAVDARGGLTAIGRRMLRFPLHPRLARILVEAEQTGAIGDAAALCARLSEAGRGSEERARKQLLSLARPGPRTAASDAAFHQAVLAGFPDRVARRRGPGSDEIVLCGGGTAELARDAGASGAELLVAVDVEERQTGLSRRTLVRTAIPIEAEWLLSHEALLGDERTLTWSSAGERVEALARLRYDQLILEERRSPPAEGELDEAAGLLADAALAAGIDRVLESGADALRRWIERVRFVASLHPDAGLAPPAEDAVRAALVRACRGLTSFAELRRASIFASLRASLTPEQARLVERNAPDRITLRGGRGVRVEYEPGKPPWIASRLQDFFGMSNGPTVGDGRTPLVLHLLAPNQRAVQVTTDLAGFWARHYPAIRRELMRRYPKHKWPDDPLA